MSSPSVERPVSALRRRMLEDMAMRGLRSDTQHEYIRFVRDFAAFLGRAPDTATAEDVRRFQVHQRESGVQPPTINCSVSALRFFFTMTLDRPDLSRRLVLARYPRKLPAVLSVEEVGRLLESAPGAKYKAVLGAAYGAGLRVSEVAALKVDDIDSERMLIRVEQGKGRKDRNAMLSPQLLVLLRLWWKEGKQRGVMLPHGWLFPGRTHGDPISTRQINRAIHLLKVEAENPNRSLYDNNRAVYSLLRYGVPVKTEAGKASQTVKLINWDKPEKNDFAIAEEVTLRGNHKRRPDLVLYVNGIAVGVIELKRSSVSIGDGIRQHSTASSSAPISGKSQ